MPPGIRPLLCAAIVAFACASPAVALASPSGGVVPRALTAPSGAPTGGVAPQAPAPAVTAASASGTADIPARYLRFYHAASSGQGFGWRILAAIGKNESDHGRSSLRGVHSGLNFANCCAGPMQICVVSSCGNTWGAYGVDGNRNGRISPYEPADSIYTAAAVVRQLRRMFGAHPDLILAGYNAGPGNVMRYGGVPPFTETQAYVQNGVAYISLLH
jgi:hypothetical protein